VVGRAYLVGLVLLVVAGAARADVFWYNGDLDSVGNQVSSVGGGDGAYALTYDDFVVPSGGWVVDTVWSNDLMGGSFSTSTAYWEIRSGVSAGDAGTLVASGTSTATKTATGRSAFGLTEYTMEVTGLSVPLDAGTYWLTVAPVASSSAMYAYCPTTSGLNAVGTPAGDDGNSFLYAPLYGNNYTPISDVLEYTPVDFSMGVGGTVQAGQVPEPCTLALFGLGALGLLRRRRR
jgi:hypothetical protein